MTTEPDKCICAGNWRNIVASHESFICQTLRAVDGPMQGEYVYFGVVHGADDYYHGLYKLPNREVLLVSCVGDITDSWGFELVGSEGRESGGAGCGD